MPILRLTASAILFCILQASFAASPEQNFERGLAAIEMGNPSRAYQLWLPLAEAGDANAQFGLGMLYMDGMGLNQDFDEAVYWLFKSADQHFAPAQFHLGNVYEKGIGVEPDIKRAVHWWELSAQQNLGAAQYRLATIYWNGGDVIAADKPRARKLFHQAQANGEFISSEYLTALQEEAFTPTARPMPVFRTVQTPSCASWLQNLSDQGYTLQMIAGQKQSSITQYLKTHTLAESHSVCAYREGNRDWFGLFYGYYADQASARSALKALPPTLQSSKPYLRKVSQVKKITQLDTDSETTPR